MINNTAVALCVCVSVSSLVFSLSEKKSSDSDKSLSVCRVSDSLVEAKRAEHACAVLVAREACQIAIGH